ncbi:MAG TPA: hypothetical protein DCW47_04230 [Lachnospiraceae bacterium]|nr:hypothetical protein [Lachnospiraceae bacterium]
MAALYLTAAAVCIGILIYLKCRPERSRLIKKACSESVKKNIKKLDPGPDSGRRVFAFGRRKIQTLVLVMLAASLMAFLMCIKDNNSHELKNGRLLFREGYEGNARNVELWARNTLSGKKQRISVQVREKRYSDEMLGLMLKELEEKLPAVLLGENSSVDHVDKKLNFISRIDGYPFELNYRTDIPAVLSFSGEINEEGLRQREGASEGVVVKVITELRYDDFQGEIDFYVRVYPKTVNDDESFFDSLKATISLASETSREADYIELPVDPSGRGEAIVEYEEPIPYDSLMVFILGAVIAFLLYKRDDETLKKEAADRDKQMLSDYPMIVNKFALFYSVGMTTRGIFLKLCRDYEKNRKAGGGKKERYAYEEMLRTRKKLEEGIGETDAYEDYALRCGLQKYRQLVNLMKQAVLKGKSDISDELSRELEQAFMERKNHARQLSEEAGTKLLAPMFLMLLVVIVIIIVPAFMNFQVR